MSVTEEAVQDTACPAAGIEHAGQPIRAEVPAPPRKSVHHRIRVRLLIAIPVIIVLLLTVMGGLFFQLVEREFSIVEGAMTNVEMQQFSQYWLVLLLAFDICGAAVGFYMAYSITSPIHALIRLSEKVAEGDFSKKAAVARQDEVGELGKTFNYMIDSLNNFVSSRNRFILESFTGGLITTDVNGTITAMNKTAERLLGLEPGQAPGKTAEAVLGSPGCEQLLAVIQETLWKKEPITSRNIEIHTTASDEALNVNSSVMRDEHGNIFGVIANFRDLHEWQRFYDQMRRTDRLATIGTFATGLAHEIRNPLGAIKGMAQLLAEDVKTNASSLEYTGIIVKEVNRLDALVREVQEFSHPSTAPMTWTDLNLLVQEAMSLARRNPSALSKPNIQLIEHYGEMPRAYINVGKITQALLNILINAFQATPEEHSITVETRFSQEDAMPLHISVTNTGSSIPAGQFHRIFEPFYTTKDTGTGLGLSITYQIVTHHGGDIQVSCDADSVSFLIKLPLQKAEEEVSF